MKKIFGLIILCFAAVPCFAADFGNPQVNRYYQAVLDVGFLDDKVAQGECLGRLGTPEARNALISILTDTKTSYWEDSAASAGLFYFTDDDTKHLLIAQFLDNHMLEDFIQKRILSHFDAYLPNLKAVYKNQGKIKLQKKLLGLIYSGKTDGGFNFIKSVAVNSHEQDRKIACGLLAKAARPEDEQFFRTLLNNTHLNNTQVIAYTLNYLLIRGHKADLPIFMPYLNSWDDALTPQAYEIGL